LLTTIRSCKPSPSKSATRKWPIWLSIGKISGPVNPKRFVPLSPRPVMQMLPQSNNALKVLFARLTQRCSICVRSAVNSLEACQPPCAFASLFPQQMHHHTTRMRLSAVLPKKNSLPGAQSEVPVDDRDAQVHRGQRRADVRRHVIVAFGRVPK